MSTRSVHSSWTDSLLIFRFVSFGILFLILILISSNIQKDGTVIYQFTTNLVGCYFSIRRLLYSWKNTNSSNHPSVYTMWIQIRHPAWPIHVLPITRTLQVGKQSLGHLSCVFFIVWARILLCCLRRCLRNAYAATVGAYAAHPFEGVPTQAQSPCKATPQCTFLPTPSHFRLLLEGWKRNFFLRDHSPIHIFAKWDALRHPALPAAARAHRLQSAHRHLAATPSSRTSTQVPKRTLNIWWINHWRLS